MPKYRRKPITVDAIRLAQEIPNYAPAGDWIIINEDGLQGTMTDEEFKKNYTECKKRRKDNATEN